MVTAQRVVVAKLVINLYMNSVNDHANMFTSTCLSCLNCASDVRVNKLQCCMALYMPWRVLTLCQWLALLHCRIYKSLNILWQLLEVKEYFNYVILNPLTWAVTYPSVHVSVGEGVISMQLPYPCVVTFCIVDHVSMRYYSWQGNYETDTVCLG